MRALSPAESFLFWGLVSIVALCVSFGMKWLIEGLANLCDDFWSGGCDSETNQDRTHRNVALGCLVALCARLPLQADNRQLAGFFTSKYKDPAGYAHRLARQPAGFAMSNLVRCDLFWKLLCAL